MSRRLKSLKISITAVISFLAVEFSDSPMRVLSYLSVFMVAGGNFWVRIDEILDTIKN